MATHLPFHIYASLVFDPLVPQDAQVLRSRPILQRRRSLSHAQQTHAAYKLAAVMRFWVAAVSPRNGGGRAPQWPDLNIDRRCLKVLDVLPAEHAMLLLLDVRFNQLEVLLHEADLFVD